MAPFTQKHRLASRSPQTKSRDRATTAESLHNFKECAHPALDNGHFVGWRKGGTMYSTPQIDNVGVASELIQGNLGHKGESGSSGKTRSPMQTALEEE